MTVEREVVVDKQSLTYEGVFNKRELHSLIMDWLDKNGYDRKELHSIDTIKPEGKYSELLIEPFKTLNDFSKSVFKIRFVTSKVKDVVIEKDGYKHTMNQGKVEFLFDAFLETDYSNRWERKQGLFVLRIIFDKYLFQPYLHDYSGTVKGDFDTLVYEIKSYLNLNRYLRD